MRDMKKIVCKYCNQKLKPEAERFIDYNELQDTNLKIDNLKE